MEVVVIALMIMGGVVAFAKLQTKNAKELASSTEAGRIAHRRTGDYPSSCSWCKNTALARRLIVFERSAGPWRAHDVLAELRGCSDGAVDALATAFVQDQARWRRFCSERCTMEFFAAERIDALEAFGSCEYCSCRYPTALATCPNCGAMGHRT